MSEPSAGYQHRIAAATAQAQSARTRLAAVRGTETSSDGAVTVSVNVQGALEDLRLGSAASSMNPDALAATIVETSRQARERAARAAADVLGTADSATPAPPAAAPSDDEDEDGYTRGG